MPQIKVNEEVRAFLGQPLEEGSQKPVGYEDFIRAIIVHNETISFVCQEERQAR